MAEVLPSQPWPTRPGQQISEDEQRARKARRAYADELTKELANKLFDDKLVKESILRMEFSVHDVSDIFRQHLDRQLQLARLREEAPSCAECGERAESAVHHPLVAPGLPMLRENGEPGVVAHKYRSTITEK